MTVVDVVIVWIVWAIVFAVATLSWMATGHCKDRIVASPRTAVFQYKPVTVRLTVETPCEEYAIFWGDGGKSTDSDCGEVFTREHDYTSPSDYLITVKVLSQGKVKTLTTTFLFR